MSNLILVDSFNFGDVSIQGLHYKDEPVFAAFEVAKILGYENPHEAVSVHCEESFLLKFREVGSSETLEMNKINGLTLEKGITLIYEADVYALILRSKLESAKKFQRWICKEVLPSIRKYGSYSINQKIELLEKETSELRKERDDALALLKKSTHNRISTYCKNEETGEMELTSKDKQLVDLQQKWAGQYILHATALSQTIHMMKALNIPLPTNFFLKDGREFFATYTEPCCEEKPTKASDIAKIIMGNGQDLFDFMR